MRKREDGEKVGSGEGEDISLEKVGETLDPSGRYVFAMTRVNFHGLDEIRQSGGRKYSIECDECRSDVGWIFPCVGMMGKMLAVVSWHDSGGAEWKSVFRGAIFSRAGIFPGEVGNLGDLGDPVSGCWEHGRW